MWTKIISISFQRLIAAHKTQFNVAEKFLKLFQSFISRVNHGINWLLASRQPLTSTFNTCISYRTKTVSHKVGLHCWYARAEKSYGDCHIQLFFAVCRPLYGYEDWQSPTSRPLAKYGFRDYSPRADGIKRAGGPPILFTPLPSPSSPLLPFHYPPSIPLEGIGPLNAATGSGERCKLPLQRGLGQNSGRNQI